jgi:hypothetical protein
MKDEIRQAIDLAFKMSGRPKTYTKLGGIEITVDNFEIYYNIACAELGFKEPEIINYFKLLEKDYKWCSKIKMFL